MMCQYLIRPVLIENSTPLIITIIHQVVGMERQEDTENAIKKPKEEKFEIYSSRKLQSLTSLQIVGDELRLEHLSREISWKDILAIDAYDMDQILVEVQLTLYVKQKKWFKGIVRCEEVIQFFILPDHAKKLLLSVRRFMTQTTIDKPKFLIFHNPTSGSDSKSKLEAGIAFLKKTHFDFELVTTQHRNHCRDYLREHKYTSKDFWGVAIFSGDGLMHEFVNSGCTLPVIHLPAGSGNAFAKNQAVLANEECGIESNLFIAMKGLTTKTSLMQIHLQKQPEKLYSTLNIEWAFLADIDMESEFLRCLGGFRFQVYSLWRYISLRNYLGRVTYSETSTDLPDLECPITNPDFKSYETNFYNFILQLMPYIAEKFCCAPLLEVNSPVMDLQTVTQQNGRFTFLKYLLNFETGGHFDLETRKPRLNFQHNLIKSFRLEPLGEMQGRIGIDGEEFEAQRVQGKIIPEALSMFTFH